MSYKDFFFLLLFFFLIQQRGKYQTTFLRTYGNTTERHYDKGYAVLETEDGGYVVIVEVQTNMVLITIIN